MIAARMLLRLQRQPGPGLSIRTYIPLLSLTMTYPQPKIVLYEGISLSDTKHSERGCYSVDGDGVCSFLHVESKTGSPKVHMRTMASLRDGRNSQECLSL